jgi:predicted helicase
MQPLPGQVIGDPACGTGGFLLAAHDFIHKNNKLDKPARKHLKTAALRGNDIVPSVVRLCAMNLYLHGIGSAKVAEASSLSSSGKNQRQDASATLAPVTEMDALARGSGTKFDMILANPPFGKKGGYTIVGDDGKISTEKQEYDLDDFRAVYQSGQVAKRRETERFKKFTYDEIVARDKAKRWQHNIGRKEIQSFVGALAGKQANKGVFITTSDYVQNATDYAESVSQKVILINGDRLADLMIEHNIGVSTVRTVELKRLDSDYFED